MNNPVILHTLNHLTHLQIYQTLTNEVDDMESFKTKLQDNNPDLAGNTQGHYDTLFGSYGY